MTTNQKQCPSQYQGCGCARPAGHEGAHYSIGGMGGWTDQATSVVRGPWERCSHTHPTAGLRCFHVEGHKGAHYAMTSPEPTEEPTAIKISPFVEWRGARKPAAGGGAP